MAVHRNRVIYQSEALFISPDATGYHFTGAHGTVATTQHGNVTANFGLMTPPTGVDQVIGGKNKKGQAVGWQCGDAWPVWNPTDEQGNASNNSYAKIMALSLNNSKEYNPQIMVLQSIDKM